MKQAKITKLSVKSKSKKKISVSWKKVKKAVGYELQVSAKKNFKKPIFKKFTAKTKLNIKNKKLFNCNLSKLFIPLAVYLLGNIVLILVCCICPYTNVILLSAL